MMRTIRSSNLIWMATAMLVALFMGCMKQKDNAPQTSPTFPATTPASPQKENALVGTWDWGWGEVKAGTEPTYQNKITLNADHSALSEIGGLAGKWERVGDVITLRWANGATDTVTISADGKRLEGKSITGVPVRGRKR